MFLFILLFFVSLFLVVNFFHQRSVLRLFDDGNVLISGLRGRGKDLLTCFVINKRKRDYISNVRYSPVNADYHFFPLNLDVWNLAGNRYTDFIDGTLKQYEYPYNDGIDYFISDSGVYFPAQFEKELVKRYGSATLFQALSRHLGSCNVHCNVQNVNRLWDKLREQSDIYICMKKSKVFFRRLRFPVAHCVLYVYSDLESCQKRIIPPFFGIGKNARDRKLQFEISHGSIKKISFWFLLKYKYDDRIFKSMLSEGRSDD